MQWEKLGNYDNGKDVDVIYREIQRRGWGIKLRPDEEKGGDT
jgi:hypothetical protein